MSREHVSRDAIGSVAQDYRKLAAKAGKPITQEQAERRVRDAVNRGEAQRGER